MKTKLILILLLLTAALLSAQNLNPYVNLIHSSRCADGNLRLRWQDPTALGLDTQCWYNANGTAWQQASTEAYSDLQMQALIPYEFGQNTRFRLRTELTLMNESVVYMHTPYLNADVFPPPTAQLGQIAVDAVGDSVTIYAPALDITESWFGATETKLYSALDNVSGSFPTLNSLFSYNLYLTTLINPDTVVDTLTYAMVYSFYIADIIQPGLYKLRLGDSGIPSFTRIGNIQNIVQGGKLYLACNLADLTNDPDFGAWPNSLNALVATTITMNLTLDPGTQEVSYGIGDITAPGVMFFEDNHYQVNANTLPSIDFHYQSGDLLVFDYVDADSDFPILMELELPDGQILEPLPQSYDYSQPVTYNAQLPASPPPAYVTIRCSDNGIDIVEYLHTFVSVADENLPSHPLGCRMPNPLRSGGEPFRISLSGLAKEPLDVQIYNLRGQKLGTLYAGNAVSGSLELPWNGTLAGKQLESGLYFLRLTQGDQILNHRFVVTK